MLEANKVYCGNCLDLMKEMDDNSIDLVVTSPPYDELRGYEGYTFEFELIAKELYRVIKDGGVVVWVVGDEVKDGSETGTSFKQVLYFKEIGFKLHDTMIYEKNSSTFPARKDGKRYTQIFEYMFVLSKGIPVANLICDKKNKWAGHTSYDKKIKTVPEFSPRTNIWKYVTSFNDKNDHPAVFPEELAKDHIKSWSNEGDLVLDPFCGSGTTMKMASFLQRDYIGIDISEKYCKMSKARLAAAIANSTKKESKTSVDNIEYIDLEENKNEENQTEVVNFDDPDFL